MCATVLRLVACGCHESGLEGRHIHVAAGPLGGSWHHGEMGCPGRVLADAKCWWWHREAGVASWNAHELVPGHQRVPLERQPASAVPTVHVRC